MLNVISNSATDETALQKNETPPAGRFDKQRYSKPKHFFKSGPQYQPSKPPRQENWEFVKQRPEQYVKRTSRYTYQKHVPPRHQGAYRMQQQQQTERHYQFKKRLYQQQMLNPTIDPPLSCADNAEGGKYYLGYRKTPIETKPSEPELKPQEVEPKIIEVSNTTPDDNTSNDTSSVADSNVPNFDSASSKTTNSNDLQWDFNNEINFQTNAFTDQYNNWNYSMPPDDDYDPNFPFPYIRDGDKFVFPSKCQIEIVVEDDVEETTQQNENQELQHVLSSYLPPITTSIPLEPLLSPNDLLVAFNDFYSSIYTNPQEPGCSTNIQAEDTSNVPSISEISQTTSTSSFSGAHGDHLEESHPKSTESANASESDQDENKPTDNVTKGNEPRDLQPFNEIQPSEVDSNDVSTPVYSINDSPDSAPTENCFFSDLDNSDSIETYFDEIQDFGKDMVVDKSKSDSTTYESLSSGESSYETFVHFKAETQVECYGNVVDENDNGVGENNIEIYSTSQFPPLRVDKNKAGVLKNHFTEANPQQSFLDVTQPNTQVTLWAYVREAYRKVSK